MKIIFLEDVKNQGKRGEIKEVPDGFANNFLIKNKKAVVATKENIARLNGQKNLEDKNAAADLKAAEVLKGKIEDLKTVVKFSEVVGPDGRLNGAVTSKEIVSELEKQFKLVIDKKKMNMESPIHTIGTHEIEVKLHHQVIAKLKVQVNPK